MQVGCAGDGATAVADGLGLALPLGVALGVGVALAVAVAVAVPVAVGDAVAVPVTVAAGVVGGEDSNSSQGGRLVPVPNCRSLMICSASLRVRAGMVDATNCCE